MSIHIGEYTISVHIANKINILRLVASQMIKRMATGNKLTVITDLTCIQVQITLP